MIIDASSSTDEFKRDLEEELLKQTDLGERLKPRIIRISAPHAEYIEFGTAGGSKTSTMDIHPVKIKHVDRYGHETMKTVEMTTFQERIYDWARTLVHSGKMKADIDRSSEYNIWSFAKAVSMKIASTGLPPQPFVRSVLYNPSAYRRAEQIFVDGGSLQDVAELYATYIRWNALEMNIGNKLGTLADDPHISDSISVEEYIEGASDTEPMELDRTVYENDLGRASRIF